MKRPSDFLQLLRGFSSFYFTNHKLDVIKVSFLHPPVLFLSGCYQHYGHDFDSQFPQSIYAFQLTGEAVKIVVKSISLPIYSDCFNYKICSECPSAAAAGPLTSEVTVGSLGCVSRQRFVSGKFAMGRKSKRYKCLLL